VLRRERPEKNTASSHFPHDARARSVQDAMVRHGLRGSIGMMKKVLVAAAIAGLSFLPTLAYAQERLGDGAMGALAGALVGGPVGLVAGGVVGYTAGPSIASSWGLKGHRHHRYAHHRHTPPRNPA
jgi:hypothetical protein